MQLLPFFRMGTLKQLEKRVEELEKKVLVTKKKKQVTVSMIKHQALLSPRLTK